MLMFQQINQFSVSSTETTIMDKMNRKTQGTRKKTDMRKAAQEKRWSSLQQIVWELRSSFVPFVFLQILSLFERVGRLSSV